MESRDHFKNGVSPKDQMSRRFFVVIVLLLFCTLTVSSQTKTITVVPDNARIWLNGSEVAVGTYVIKFNNKTDFVMLKFYAPGYYVKTIKLFKTDPRKTISYNLQIDEAEANSIGGEAALNANRWVNITVKSKLDEDAAWKRLMATVTEYFDQIETRDKGAGWIKTSWITRDFGGVVQVRTMLEIKADFSGDGLGYRARLVSEIKWSGENSEGWQKYDRILKKYENVINDIQTRLGSGE